MRSGICERAPGDPPRDGAPPRPADRSVRGLGRPVIRASAGPQGARAIPVRPARLAPLCALLVALIGCDHPAYRKEVAALPEPIRRSLASDLA